MTPIRYIVLVTSGYLACLYLDKHWFHLDPTEGIYILVLWSIFIVAPLFNKRLGKWIGIPNDGW